MSAVNPFHNAAVSSSAPAVTTVPRPVGDRCELATSGRYNSGSNVLVTYNTAHKLIGTARRLRLLYTTRMLGTGGETLAANPFTTKASVVAGGRLVKAYFGGARSKPCAIGEDIVSDPLPVAAAAGGRIFVRSCVTTTGTDAATRKVPVYGFNGQAALGEWYIAGTDLADSLSEAGVTNAGAVGCFGPAAILGDLDGEQRAAAILGSSTAFGQGDTPDAPDFALGIFARALTLQGVPYVRLGQPGDTLAQMMATWQHRQTLLKLTRPTHVVNNMGANDITAGSTYQAIVDLLQALWDGLDGLGLGIIQATYHATTTTSDGFATAVGQTLSANKPVRDQLNAYVRTRPHRAIVGIWDIDQAVGDPLNPGRWRSDGTANKWTADGIHLSAHAHRTVAPLLPAVF